MAERSVGWRHTYYWSGSGDGVLLFGVAVGISSRMPSSVIGVTYVDERILLVRLRHTFGFISLAQG